METSAGYIRTVKPGAHWSSEHGQNSMKIRKHATVQAFEKVWRQSQTRRQWANAGWVAHGALFTSTDARLGTRNVPFRPHACNRGLRLATKRVRSDVRTAVAPRCCEQHEQRTRNTECAASCAEDGLKPTSVDAQAEKSKDELVGIRTPLAYLTLVAAQVLAVRDGDRDGADRARRATVAARNAASGNGSACGSEHGAGRLLPGDQVERVGLCARSRGDQHSWWADLPV
ncbi:hypothetical protein FGB62_158g03 [Gracilaria domingensis]|nr:hypothetical protein FGB62_158g03 [Gracilaria domingensis]